MSFFESASLVFISDFAAASASMVSGSGTNTGKAYSIKPTDGNGDFDFERGSDITATRVNSSGLIEKGRGNEVIGSNDFTLDNVNYTSSQGEIGYDGSLDAWLINKKVDSNVYFNKTNLTSTGVTTISIYAKANSVDQLFLFFSGNSVRFDLTSGTSTKTGGTVVTHKALLIGEEGWYRCSMTINETDTNNILVKPQSSGADTIGTIFVQDIQFEQGLVATDVIKTTTEPLRAGILEDEPRFDYYKSGSATPNTCPSLLLEPSRDNEITNSEYFEGTNWGVGGSTEVELITSITSPDGTNSVYLVTSEEGNNSSRVQYNLGALGNDYIFSVFIKGTGTATRIRLRNNTASVDAVEYDIDSSGNFTLHSENAHDGYYGAEPYGNGWYRVYLKVETNSISNNFMQIFSDIIDADGSIYVWGAQAEEGSYITSYIPTYGTAAERSTDSFEKTGLSSVIGQTEGTIFFEFEYSHQQVNTPFFRVFENASNLYEIIALSSYKLRSRARIGGSIVAAIDTANVVAEGTHKAAITYKSGDYRFYLDGSLVGSSTETSIVSNPSKINYFDNNNNLKQFLIFPTALFDADCRTLTT